MKTTKLIKVVLSLFILVTITAACSPPRTLTTTITEEEFRQEQFICRDYGLQVDFQSGKMICNGEIEGEQVVIEVIAEVVDGKGRLQILHFSRNGKNLAPEEFADLNIALAEDTWNPEESYAITSIIITDNDLTITQSLK